MISVWGRSVSWLKPGAKTGACTTSKKILTSKKDHQLFCVVTLSVSFTIFIFTAVDYFRPHPPKNFAFSIILIPPKFLRPGLPSLAPRYATG